MNKKNHHYTLIAKIRAGHLLTAFLLAILACGQTSNAATNYFRFYTTSVPLNSGPDNPSVDTSVGTVSISGSSLNANDVVVFDGVDITQSPGTTDQWGAINLDQGGYDGLTGAALAVKVETGVGSGNASGLFPAGTSFGDSGSTSNHVRIVLTATTPGSTTNMNYLAEVDPNFTGTFIPLSGTVTFPNNTIALTFGANNHSQTIYDNSGFFAAAQPTPTNATTIPGQTITLRGNYEGSPANPLAVQWFKNGSPIPNATNLTYTTAALTGADNGARFSYVLTNLNNTAITATSATTTIAVRSTPGYVAFNFPTTTTAAVDGGVTSPGVAILGTQLLAGDTVVFDGIVVPNGSEPSDAWTAVNIDGSGYGNVTSAQLGVLDRQGTGPSQLFINGSYVSNPTSGGAPTNRVRIELFPSATGSTTNMGWLVEIDQNLTGTFLPALSGTNLTFPNNTLTLTFGSSGGSAIITQDPQSPVSIFSGPTPASQVVAVGAPATVGVTVLGWSPAFQWRKNGAAIPHATNETYTLPSASLSDNGDQFTVVVSNQLNSLNVVTSSVASLAVLIPNNLSWYPTADYTTWDIVTKNWTTNGGTSEIDFANGNNVTFDSLGYNIGGNEVTVTNAVNPNAVTVNVNSSDEYDYLGTGSVNGQSLLLEGDGTGTLGLQTTAIFGSATIANGSTLNIGDQGNGPDAVFAANSITNNGVINFQNTDLLTISGVITGSGSVVQNWTGTTILSATNSSYAIGGINYGDLIIASTPAPGPILNNGTIEPNSSASVLAIPNAISGGGGFHFTGFQTTIVTGASTFTGANGLQWSHVIVDNPNALGDTTYGSSAVGGADNLSGLYLSNNITWIQPLELDPREDASLEATAPHVANWSGTNFLSSPLTFATGQGGSEINVEATAGLLTINSVLANNAGNNANNLNLQGGATGIWSGALIDGPEPLNILKRGSGTWTLAGNNSYSGTTTVSDGILLIDGEIGTNNVTVESGGTLGGLSGTIAGAVTVESGGTLSAFGGGANTLAIDNSLTLASGSFTSLEVNKTAHTSDEIAGVTSLAYGGTLVVTNLSGTLANGDAFKLFSASTYSGGFASVSPTVPGPGLIWVTSSLTTSGTLGVATGSYVNPTPTNITTMLEDGGTTLVLSWPYDHTGWRLETTTNLANPNWVTVSGSSSTDQVSVVITTNHPSVFYRMIYP